MDPMNREKKAITVALYGLLIALAMVLGFVETMIPIPIPVPGIKLGLANLVTVVGLYLIGIPGTIAVTLIRIVLVGLSFGNPYSMIYGLSGSFLSLFVMAVLKKTGKLSQVSISVLGGIAIISADHLCGSYRPDTRGILLSAISSGSRMHRGNIDQDRRRNHYGAASACDAGDKK